MDSLFYAYDELQKFTKLIFHLMILKQFQLNTSSKFTPRLIFPAFNIGIFFEYFLIHSLLFRLKPVVPITTLFLSFDAILRMSSVQLGIVKSIITSVFLKAVILSQFYSINFFY